MLFHSSATKPLPLGVNNIIPPVTCTQAIEFLLNSCLLLFMDFVSYRLTYNDSSKKMGNSPGVDVRVPYFGSTKGVSYLDPSLYHPGEYFANMVEALVKIGFEDGVSLRAAPFDFRYAPSKF